MEILHQTKWVYMLVDEDLETLMHGSREILEGVQVMK